MSESRHIVCPSCDAINRIPNGRMNSAPKCGKCGTLVFEGEPLELTAANFQKHISRNDIPVLVDFWAPWCGPCKMMAPAFKQAAKTLEPQMRLVKVNTEEQQSLGAQFGIRSIPSLVLFKNGKEVARQAGAMAANELIAWAQSKR